MLAIFLIAPLILLICLLSIVREIDGAQGSDGNSGKPKSQKERKVDIDLNKPYIEGNSSENDSSSAAPLKNTLASTSITQVQKKPYIYRPRKPIDLLSQSKSAISSRKKFQRLRQEGNVEKLNEILEKQKERIKPIAEKNKLKTQTYGYSSRPRDIKSRQLREKVRLGLATVEEHNYVKTQKLKAKPSEKRKSEKMTALREKVRLGTATLEEFNRVQRRRASNRAYYHRINNGNPPKKGLDIDLNQEYVPDTSSPNPTPHEEQQRSPNPVKEQRPYVYRKRKAESEYSQNPKTKRSRERMEYMRKNDKEAFDAYRKGEKERLAHVKERDKELTKQYGTSMRRGDIKIRQSRARIKQGIASKEDIELNEKRKNLFKQYRISLKEAGIKRIQNSKINEARNRRKQGIATKEDLDRIEEKRLTDKKRYEKKKKEKLINKIQSV